MGREYSYQELTRTNEHAWSRIARTLRSGRVDARALPREDARAERTLVALQVSTRFPLGAVAAMCGGMLALGGAVRLLGGGATGLPSLSEANSSRGRLVPGRLDVGYDVLGGVYSLDGGELGGEVGTAWYLPPGSGEWEKVTSTYEELLDLLLTGGTLERYEGALWDGWEADVAALRLDEGVDTSAPGGEGPARRVVPLKELLSGRLGGERDWALAP